MAGYTRQQLLENLAQGRSILMPSGETITDPAGLPSVAEVSSNPAELRKRLEELEHDGLAREQEARRLEDRLKELEKGQAKAEDKSDVLQKHEEATLLRIAEQQAAAGAVPQAMSSRAAVDPEAEEGDDEDHEVVEEPTGEVDDKGEPIIKKVKKPRKNRRST